MADIKVKKREGENFNSLLFRFRRRVRQSGIMREARRRRFYQRPENKNKRRLAALHRVRKEQEIKEMKRYGHSPSGRGR